MNTIIENVVPADVAIQLKKLPLYHRIILTSGVLANPNLIYASSGGGTTSTGEILTTEFNNVISKNDCMNLFLSIHQNTSIASAIGKLILANKNFALISYGKNFIGFCTLLSLNSVEKSSQTETLSKHVINVDELTSCRDTDSILVIFTTLAQDNSEYIRILDGKNKLVCVVSAQIMIKILFEKT